MAIDIVHCKPPKFVGESRLRISRIISLYIISYYMSILFMPVLWLFYMIWSMTLHPHIYIYISSLYIYISFIYISYIYIPYMYFLYHMTSPPPFSRPGSHVGWRSGRCHPNGLRWHADRRRKHGRRCGAAAGHRGIHVVEAYWMIGLVYIRDFFQETIDFPIKNW